MMHHRVPHRLFPDEHPSLPRLVQLVLCDDEWARIDAYRMAYEHIHGTSLGEREAEAYIRRKTAVQQRVQSFLASAHDFNATSGFADLDRGGVDYPLDDGLANLSLNNGDPARHDPALGTPASGILERPRMERASTSTSGVSVVVPCKEMPTSDMRAQAAKVKKDSLATLASFSSQPRVGPSSPASRIHPSNSDIGDRDREYKHWGRLDDPDSVWNQLHVERPQLNEQRRFSSYKEYKKARNQPMKDNDQLFKKRMRQSFAKEEVEVLSVDGSGGHAGDVGDDEDYDCEETERPDGDRVAANRTEPKRQILLVKRRGNLAGQNL